MTDIRATLARSAARRTRRAERVAENTALSIETGQLSQKEADKCDKKNGKKKVPKAKLRKRLIKALDKAFSLAVRALWKACPFCGGTVEHAFHFVTRAKYSVRWDERNAVGSCAGCNYRYEFDPHFAIAWFIANRGLDAYSQLIRDGNQIAKHTNEDLQKRLDEIGRANA